MDWSEVTVPSWYIPSNKLLLYNIPDELITIADQTSSKYDATDNVTMTAKGEKHISWTGFHDKRSITLTIYKPHNGIILLFQPIHYT